MDCYLTHELRQCCCVCKYHIEDHYHCMLRGHFYRFLRRLGVVIAKCICDKHKGWICHPPEMGYAHSAWPEHSLGCEFFKKREAVKI